MCDNYGLPLALIFEEILIDKPPKETEEEQEKEGTGGNGLAAPPPLFVHRRRQAACKGRQTAFAALVVWGIAQGLKTLLGASMGLVGRSMLSAAEQSHRRQQLPPPPSKSRSRSLGPTAPPLAACRPLRPLRWAHKESGGGLRRSRLIVISSLGPLAIRQGYLSSCLPFCLFPLGQGQGSIYGRKRF